MRLEPKKKFKSGGRFESCGKTSAARIYGEDVPADSKRHGVAAVLWDVSNIPPRERNAVASNVTPPEVPAGLPSSLLEFHDVALLLQKNLLKPDFGLIGLAWQRTGRAILDLTVSRARLRQPAGNCGGRRWRRCSGNSSAAPSGHRRRPSPDRSTPACPRRPRGRRSRARAWRPPLRAACARCTWQCPSRNLRHDCRRCCSGKIRSAGRQFAESSGISSPRGTSSGGL